jgi:enediyne biosynthesis protein E4
VVRITAGGETLTQMLRSGSSYLSQSENILTFGLGSRTQADAVEIHWPSGTVDRMSNVKSGGVVTITER